MAIQVMTIEDDISSTTRTEDSDRRIAKLRNKGWQVVFENVSVVTYEGMPETLRTIRFERDTVIGEFVSDDE